MQVCIDGATMPKVENRTTLSISTDLTRKARARAISEGTSLSAVVAIFLKAWLEGEIELPEPQEIKSEGKPKKKSKPIE